MGWELGCNFGLMQLADAQLCTHLVIRQYAVQYVSFDVVLSKLAYVHWEIDLLEEARNVVHAPRTDVARPHGGRRYLALLRIRPRPGRGGSLASRRHGAHANPACRPPISPSIILPYQATRKVSRRTYTSATSRRPRQGRSGGWRHPSPRRWRHQPLHASDPPPTLFAPSQRTVFAARQAAPVS